MNKIRLDIEARKKDIADNCGIFSERNVRIKCGNEM